MPKKVFISYSHDSDAHVERVRKLAHRLRADGVECIIDQYEQNWLKGDAALCMQRWIEESDVVLIACTEIYKRRMEKKEAPRKGRGAKLEGMLIRNSIYRADSDNSKFVPILFEYKDEEHVPLLLAGANYYVVEDQAGFDALYAYLTDQNPNTPPSVGKIVTIPPTEPDTPFVPPRTATPKRPAGASNVPAPSPTFVPRKNITKQIHDALNAPGHTEHTSFIRQAAARAHGGFGKSVAAILYAHEYASHYPGGRFFLSMEKADLTTALASLGQFFDVPADATPAAAAATVKHGLENAMASDGTPAPTLLILDNIVDAAQWDTFLASRLIPRGNCRILITTRAETIPQAMMIRVGKLTNEEAREIYRKFCKLADVRGGGGRDAPSDATADAITTLVGGLAVAVAAVAARMKLRPEISWDDYAKSLAQLPIDSLPDASDEVRKEIGTAGTALAEHRRTLRIIDDALDALPAPERRALDYAALLPEDMVPAPWLIWLLEHDAARPAKRDDGSSDPLKFSLVQDPDIPGSAAVRVLKHLDTLDLLLEKAEDGKLLSLHRLWRQRIIEQATENKQDTSSLWSAIAACARERRAVVVGVDEPEKLRSIDNPHAVTNASLRWELTPLISVAVSLARAGRLKDAETVAGWIPYPLKLLGRLEEARTTLDSLLTDPATAQSELGDADFASLLTNLALIQKDQGDLPGARASMERAIVIEEKHFAPDHPTLAISYSNLAAIQRAQGDLSGARASMERAIAIQKKHFSPDHPAWAISYSNLAAIQRAQGDLPGARASMERAIAIEEKHFAPDHPTFAVRWTNLGAIDHDQGMIAAACANFNKALAIDLKHFGEDHPHTQLVRLWLKEAGCDCPPP